MPDLLDLTAHLPEVGFDAGDTVFEEGGASGGLWVLVSGALGVWTGDVVVGSLTRPGALVGEVSLLLGIDHWATVRATEATRVRYAADGQALLDSRPEVITQVAVGLARRLTGVTAYLADLEHQYGDAPGLAMVGEVLSRITMHHPPATTTGSARDPEPEY
jgi:CRP/FNR family cyclic AMP-dependent transcriptional regulator